MSTGKQNQELQPREYFTAPRTDLVETTDHFRLFLDLPGVPKDQVNIKVRGGVLSVTGIPEPVISPKKKTLRGEVIHATFQRSFVLPEEVVDIDNVSAHLENGVLTMTLPKRIGSRARRIPVQRVQ